MRLRFKAFLIAALIASSAASTPALSQSQPDDSGWFIGAGGGVAKFREGCPSQPYAPGFTCDDRGTAWKVFGGYQFNSYFGFELAYGSLGKVTQSQAGVTNAEFDTKAIDMVLVLTIPFNRQISAYGKWGLAQWQMDRTITGVGAGTTDVSGREITYGFGMGYNVTRNIALQLEWQRYWNIGDVIFTGISDVDLSSFRIAFKF